MLIPTPLLKRIRAILEQQPALLPQEVIDTLLAAKGNRFTKAALNSFVAIYFEDRDNGSKNGPAQPIRVKVGYQPAALLHELQMLFIRKFDKPQLLDMPRSLLLTGPIGGGKTTLLKQFNDSIASLYSSRYIPCHKHSLESLAELELKKDCPTMFILDDIDLLIPSKKAARPIQLYRFVDSLMACPTGHLIVATSRPEALEEGLRRPGRLDRQFDMGLPTAEERQAMLLDIHLQLAPFVQKTHGFLPADFKALQNELAFTQMEQGQLDFKAAFERVKPISRREGFASIPSTGWADVGALSKQKEVIYNSVIFPLKKKKEFEAMNISPSTGILLFGPPGCGKTMLAKAVAHQVSASFITVKGPELLSKYVGESEEALRSVFQRARSASPTVIFFDEFDAIAPRRQSQGNQVSERVVNTLLNEMSGFDETNKGIFVIAATNRPDMIDPAVLRSGRLQKHICVPIPSPEDRVAILASICAKVQIDRQHVDLEKVAMHAHCEGCSGADLQSLVKEAGLTAILSDRTKITQSDFDSVVSKLKPSLSSDQRLRYDRMYAQMQL